MKLTPYQKLLTMAKDAVDATLAPVRARSAQKQGELEICKLEEQLATLETQVNEIASKTPINFCAILDKLDELALAERRKNQFEELLTQLFPGK